MSPGNKPYFFNAEMANSEQLGEKRQEGMGRNQTEDFW
jgi:hypothetical protein